MTKREVTTPAVSEAKQDAGAETARPEVEAVPLGVWTINDHERRITALEEAVAGK